MVQFLWSEVLPGVSVKSSPEKQISRNYICVYMYIENSYTVMGTDKLEVCRAGWQESLGQKLMLQS